MYSLDSSIVTFGSYSGSTAIFKSANVMRSSPCILFNRRAYLRICGASFSVIRSIWRLYISLVTFCPNKRLSNTESKPLSVASVFSVCTCVLYAAAVTFSYSRIFAENAAKALRRTSTSSSYS